MINLSTLSHNYKLAFPLTESAVSDIVRWVQNEHIDDNQKLIDYYSVYCSYLLQQFNIQCQGFDNANDEHAMEPSFAVNTKADKFDCFRLYLWSWLYGRCLIAKVDKKFKYDLINIVGRFTLCYIESPIFVNEESDNMRSIVASLISYIVSYEWTFDELQYVKLTLLNLLLLSGIRSQDEIQEYIEPELLNLKSRNQEQYISISSIINAYIDFTTHPQSGQPLCTDWFYAVIYKKRFGFILCKRIRALNNLQFSAIAYSPCFLPPYRRNIILYKQSIIFKKGENRRCKDYIPPEDTAYYNFSTMQFE